MSGLHLSLPDPFKFELSAVDGKPKVPTVGSLTVKLSPISALTAGEALAMAQADVENSIFRPGPEAEALLEALQSVVAKLETFVSLVDKASRVTTSVNACNILADHLTGASLCQHCVECYSLVVQGVSYSIFSVFSFS